MNRENDISATFRLSFKGLIAAFILFIHCPLVGGWQNAASTRHVQYGNETQWQTSAPIGPGMHLRPIWQIDAGQGYGQVVGDEDAIFLSSGQSNKDSETGKTKIVTTVSSFETKSGKQRWERRFESVMHSGQESFGGAYKTPRATPLLLNDRVYVVSFTGELYCLDATSGKTIWQKELVKDFRAVPVQFGFSSSPVFDAKNPSDVLVLAAGAQGGLLNFDAATGNLNWRCASATFSYATPTSANFGGVPQWIIVSENHISGVGKSDGKKLWSLPLDKQGLTNVPCPLVVSDSELLISGQGCRGTRKISVKRSGAKWQTSERWFQPKATLFYTNWIQLDSRTLLGCTDKLLTAIDLNNGNVIGKWRGYANGNLIRNERQICILGGKGQLTSLDGTRKNGLERHARFKVANGRCWTPPTFIGSRMLIRFDNQLACFSVSTEKTNDELKNSISRRIVLKIEPAGGTAEPDHVERIVNTFETQGKQAALKLYADLRAASKLSVEQRIALAEGAQQQGLSDLSRMILTHAAADFPESKLIKQKLTESGKL